MDSLSIFRGKIADRPFLFCSNFQKEVFAKSFSLILEWLSMHAWLWFKALAISRVVQLWSELEFRRSITSFRMAVAVAWSTWMTGPRRLFILSSKFLESFTTADVIFENWDFLFWGKEGEVDASFVLDANLCFTGCKWCLSPIRPLASRRLKRPRIPILQQRLCTWSVRWMESRI